MLPDNPEETSALSAMRMVFLTFSALILIGRYLTGFQAAHWFPYIPAAAAFAGITGICPGYRVSGAPGFKGQLPVSNIQTARSPALVRVSPARGALPFSCTGTAVPERRVV